MYSQLFVQKLTKNTLKDQKKASNINVKYFRKWHRANSAISQTQIPTNERLKGSHFYLSLWKRKNHVSGKVLCSNRKQSTEIWEEQQTWRQVRFRERDVWKQERKDLMSRREKIFDLLHRNLRGGVNSAAQHKVERHANCVCSWEGVCVCEREREKKRGMRPSRWK